jgi:hypothetical protein
MKVEHVATSITSFKSQLALVTFDLTRVCTNLASIGTQLLRISTSVSILPQLAHVTTTINQIGAKISPIQPQVT